MTRPFVYINVSGGIAEEYALGAVDILHIDWDNYRDEGNYTRNDIADKLVELRAKWPKHPNDSYRKRIIADLLEIGHDIPRD